MIDSQQSELRAGLRGTIQTQILKEVLYAPSLAVPAKDEREMPKRIAAVAMNSRIGETFDAIVTGVISHGTFVRVLKSAVEGLLVQGQQGADVGDKLHVKLTGTDI